MSENNVYHDRQINALFRRVLDNGHDHADRTGKGRRSVFGEQVRFNVSDGTIPLQTTRKIFHRGIIEELLWFLKGDTNSKTLEDKKVNIWKPWALREEDVDKFAEKIANIPKFQEAFEHLIGVQEGENLVDKIKEYYRKQYSSQIGQIGKLYGGMWRNAPQQSEEGNRDLWPDVKLEDIPSDKLELYTKEYEELKVLSHAPTDEFEAYVKYRYYNTVDQIGNLLMNLKYRPFSSRHVVVSWVPSHAPFETIGPQENVLVGKSALTACHAMFQCFVHPPKVEGGKNRLSLQMYIRSQDLAVGSNFNMVQYTILLMMLAQVCDMEPYEYIHTVGDCHFYLNHLDQVREQIEREPFPSPVIRINPNVKDLFAFKLEDFEIVGYQHHEDIKYEVAV